MDAGKVQLLFICDTKQGSRLEYARNPIKLANLEKVTIAGRFILFQCSSSNWTVIGNNNDANSCFGSGYIVIKAGEEGQSVWPISWLTYFTNGAYKEVIMRVEHYPVSQISNYVP